MTLDSRSAWIRLKACSRFSTGPSSERYASDERKAARAWGGNRTRLAVNPMANQLTTAFQRGRDLGSLKGLLLFMFDDLIDLVNVLIGELLDLLLRLPKAVLGKTARFLNHFQFLICIAPLIA